MAGPEDMRAQINRYTPGNTLPEAQHGFPRVAVQLFGMTGHGKSSLINSCVYALSDGEYRNIAGAGLTDGAMTLSRTEHELTPALVMIDNRGFPKLDSDEVQEACAQLRSLRDIGEVSWENSLAQTLKQIPDKYSLRPADLIVPVFVYSAAQLWSPNDVSGIEKLITNAFRITGIHPIVVITRCSDNRRNEVWRKFGEIGVMRRQCLENYTENDFQRSEEKDKNILEFLDTCIKEAEWELRNRLNQDRQTRFVRQAVDQVRQETELMSKDIRQLRAQGDKKGMCKTS